MKVIDTELPSKMPFQNLNLKSAKEISSTLSNKDEQSKSFCLWLKNIKPPNFKTKSATAIGRSVCQYFGNLG